MLIIVWRLIAPFCELLWPQFRALRAVDALLEYP
jgi:hypothetical protein